jgi:hypothetical protein
MRYLFSDLLRIEYVLSLVLIPLPVLRDHDTLIGIAEVDLAANSLQLKNVSKRERNKQDRRTLITFWKSLS